MAFTPIDDDITEYGDLVSVEMFQAIADNINHLIDGAQPGKIMMIATGITGVPDPDPKIWQLCDGSLITEPSSPMYGQYTRDMVSATRTINSLTFKSKVSGTSTIAYLGQIPLVASIAAAKTIQTVHYVADTAGAGGNAITIAIVIDVILPAVEYVAVVGNAITVHVTNYGGPGVPKTLTTAAGVMALVNGYGPSAALVTASLTDAGTTIVNAQAATHLTGGVNSIPAYPLAGGEIVTVSGHAVTVRIQSGVSSIQQIKTAIEASVAASAVFEMIINDGVDPDTVQTAPMITQAITPGVFMKCANTTGTDGQFGGANSKSLAHSHGGVTGTMDNLTLDGDEDSDRYSTANHTHTISDSLTTPIDFQPAHIRIRHYLKIT